MDIDTLYYRFKQMITYILGSSGKLVGKNANNFI